MQAAKKRKVVDYDSPLLLKGACVMPADPLPLRSYCSRCSEHARHHHGVHTQTCMPCAGAHDKVLVKLLVEPTGDAPAAAAGHA
ncbi:hypothetical protein EON66_12285 [archaeon]|nr:MAG: hypothetical protein EON66_12285 [archaeon]